MCAHIVYTHISYSPQCNYYRDYQSIPRLDTYDPEHLDTEEYDTIEPETRVAAEKAMRKRDRQVS